MGRVPIEAGFFTIPDDRSEPPRLLGSRCQACAETFFPRRLVCAKCLHVGTDDVQLGPTGRLWTWTYVRVPLFAKRNAKVSAYGVGQIDLPEGPRVQAPLAGKQAEFAVGRQVRGELNVLRSDGAQDIVIVRFRPVEGSA
jgi:uncharacterized OB-fold protein